MRRESVPEQPQAGQTSSPRPGYEPPRVTVLGSLAELTKGIVPTTTDGVLPGSIL